MRVITGSARGMKLVTPEGMDVRPTTEKVKESIFNIIQFDIPGARVLDLFAGSGQLGIESLSRGASYCTFVDRSAYSLEFVKQNLDHTKLAGSGAIVKNEDSMSFLRKTRDTYDIVFLDPPYRKQIITEVLPLLVPHLSDGGIIVCETAREEDLPQAVEDFSIYREYNYGKIKLTIYKKQEEDEDDA